MLLLGVIGKTIPLVRVDRVPKLCSQLITTFNAIAPE